MSGKVPTLQKQDGTTTDGKGEQAEKLLKSFFPPLPVVRGRVLRLFRTSLQDG